MSRQIYNESYQKSWANVRLSRDNVKHKLAVPGERQPIDWPLIAFACFIIGVWGYVGYRIVKAQAPTDVPMASQRF